MRRLYDPDLAYGYQVNPTGDNFTEVELLTGFGDDVFSLEYEDACTSKPASDNEGLPGRL